MFKFDTIDNKRKFLSLKQSNVKNKITGFHNTPSTIENPLRSTFIVAETVGKSIIGGACLVKKKLEDINDIVRELITTQTIRDGFIWECSSVYLELSSTFPPSGTTEAETLAKTFYKGLYDEFVGFGKKNAISFVVMKLTPEVYTSTKEFGLWPYVVELKPHQSRDGLFHGVLPLKGSQYEAYKKTWDTLDPYFKDISCDS